MKGNEELIKKLGELLADELTAVNQYMVHSEMCANWGYDAIPVEPVVGFGHAGLRKEWSETRRGPAESCRG